MAQITEKKKITNEKMAALLFWLCWLAYFCTYIGRLNYNASITEILRAENITKAQAGFISTCSFFTYGIGQLCNGIVSDRVSSKWMMFIGLTVSATVNIFMGLAHSVAFMTILWGINGFAQSMTWAPIIKLFSDYLPARSRVKASVNISTSYAVGTLVSYLLTAVCVAVINWRATFFSAAIFMFVVAAIWFVGLTKVERHSERHGVIEESAPMDPAFVPEENVSFRHLMMASGMLFIGIAVIMHGILKDGVTTWVPTYVSEIFRIGSSASILASTLLPIINLSGVYTSSWLNRRYFKNEMITSAFFFILAIAALLCLIYFGEVNVILAVLLLSVTTSSMVAINTMIICVIPLHFAKSGKSASATGVLNSFTYVGSAVSSYGIGAISGAMGWNFTIWVWVGIAVVGLVFCIATSRRWIRFKNANA
ncbi:MAG: MFS transporter [Clostridia bacterium]|nr:MFS transporter [Clostridia bacterium]